MFRWNATYDNLLGTNKPFAKPIPLPVSLNFLKINIQSELYIFVPEHCWFFFLNLNFGLKKFSLVILVLVTFLVLAFVKLLFWSLNRADFAVLVPKILSFYFYRDQNVRKTSSKDQNCKR